MWPSLPFIDQGGKHFTTWDPFPREPSYPPRVHPLHRADLLASLGFPLVAENLHDTVLVSHQEGRHSTEGTSCLLEDQRYTRYTLCMSH